MPTEITALTPEQTAALSRYRARWAAVRRSTAAEDRGAAEEGARLAYHAAGLKPPARFVWCGSPLALSSVARRPARADGANVKSAVVDLSRRQAAARVGRRVDARVRTAVEIAVNPPDALVAAAAETIMQSVADENASLLKRYCRSEPLVLADLWRALLGQEGFRYVAAGPHQLSWLGPYEYFANVLACAPRPKRCVACGNWH